MPEYIPNKLDKHSDTLYPEKHPGKAPVPEANALKQIDSIMLVTKAGQKVELTAAMLDKWFATIETGKYGKQEHSEALIVTQLLSRFGLKNSVEVIKFLKSPAGESILTLIGDQLAEIASIQEYQRAEMLESQRRYERMVAFLLLALVHKHDAKAKSLNEFIQQQINQALKKSADAKKTAATDVEARRILQKQYDTLEESAKYLESLLADKTGELGLLHQDKLALQQEGMHIEERHTILQESVLHLDNDSDYIKLDPDNAHHYLTNRINILNMAFHENSRQISNLEAENKPHEARKLLHRNHGLRLHIDGLGDLHAVHRKEKVLYTKDGEETDSFKDAAFVLRPDLKIVKDGAGLRYLIGAKQNLADMDESMKAQARHKFQELKPEICCIKNLVAHQCKREKNYHRDCVHSVDKHIECREKELTLIKNQHHHIRAAQANVLAEMKKMSPDLVKANNMQKSMPNVSSGMSVNKTLSGPDMVLRQSMNALQKNPTPQNINNLANNLTNIYGRVPGSVREDLNKIIPGRPIPEVLLRSLNRSIYRIKMATDVPELTPDPKPGLSWPPKPSPYK